MPERSWLRRRQRDRRATSLAEASARATDTSTTRAEFLRRAVGCYLRAGELTEAARCLSALSAPGERSRAAELYLRAGEYRLAAEAYSAAGRVEAAAWTQVHYLGDVASARAILDRNPAPHTPPVIVTSFIDTWPATNSSWGRRVTQVADRLAASPEPDGGGESPRAAVTALADRMLGDEFNYDGIESALADLRQLAKESVAAREFPAAYAALDLARLLTDLRTEHSERDEQIKRASHEDWYRALAQRQVRARCDVAEGNAGDQVLEVLAITQDVLADTSDAHYTERAETWGVAIAEAMRRYDQVALIFAAAVRGHRPGAAKRWREWSGRVLHADASIPSDLELVQHGA